MKYSFKIFLLLALLFSYGNAKAQVLERYIKSKAQVVAKRAFERTDKEIDTMLIESVDKQMDKQLKKPSDEEGNDDSPTPVSPGTGQKSASKSSSSVETAAGNAFLKQFGISNAPVNVQEAYKYKGFLLMEIESWNAGGEKENQTLYKTYFSEDAESFAMEFTEPGKGQSLIIFDNINRYLLILSDDGNEKSGMVMPLNTGETEYESTDEDNTAESVDNSSNSDETDITWLDSQYKKTGNKKNISGYPCEEYEYENEEEILSFWITQDLPADLYSRIFGLNTFANLSYTGAQQGFTMEWDLRKKNTAERSKMVVKEVDKNKPSSISTKGYNLFSYGNYQP